jgi:hypothetical protein
MSTREKEKTEKKKRGGCKAATLKTQTSSV